MKNIGKDIGRTVSDVKDDQRGRRFPVLMLRELYIDGRLHEVWRAFRELIKGLRQ